MVHGIASGSISWEEDPDFGYLVATDVPGVDDPELLRPRRLYERQRRAGEYDAKVASLRDERRKYLANWPALRSEIALAL